MNLGVRSILLLAAVLMFVLAVFSEENYADLVPLGLAAFAAAFLSDAMGWGDRTFTTSTPDRDRDRT